MKLIGKGAFTKAYLTEDNKVFLRTVDPIKECMAYGWFPECYLFPTVELTDEIGEYTMEYYPKVSSIKNNVSPRQWRLYQALRKLDYYTGRNPNMMQDHWHKQFDSLPSEFRKEKEMLKHALDACANYGSDVCFEISPRNIATKGNKLVLLDCFFMSSKLNEVRWGSLRVA